MTPWYNLRVTRDGKRLYGTHARRALTRWRTGGLPDLVVTHNGAAVEVGKVSWRGWEDEAPRPSGTQVSRSERTGVAIEVWVPEAVRDALDVIGGRTGETRGAVIARLVLAELKAP